MNCRRMTAALGVLALCCWGVTSVRADDLGDNIPLDDDIAKYGDISQPDKNINYIILKAKSQARRDNEKEGKLAKGGDLVQGGVILKPGAQAKDITVIYQGKNNVVVGK